MSNIGYEKLITLKSSKWSLLVDPCGGRIKELAHKDRIILGTFERIDGKTGNTHICCPNFGNEGVEEYGLPFHGPGRNAEWKIEEAGSNSLMISFVLTNIGNYPGKLAVYQKFVLDSDKFLQEIKVKNTGTLAVPVNVAIHNYWNCPNGWEGLRLNGHDVSDVVKADAFVDINEESTIELPGLNPIKLVQNGMPHARLWTGRSGNGSKQIFDQKYVCIEPARGKDDRNFFGSSDCLLPSGGLIIVSQSVCIQED